jgi:hypothetical protein
VVPTSGTNAFTCSVEVENFDETEKIILSNGEIIAVPKMAIPGRCWQGYFLYSDQNVLGIFETNENIK